MIVVDTAVWADWFKGADSPEVGRLDHGLEVQDVGLVAVVLTEVLQGFRADSDFARARDLLLGLPILTLDPDGHVAAARQRHHRAGHHRLHHCADLHHGRRRTAEHRPGLRRHRTPRTAAPLCSLATARVSDVPEASSLQ